MAEREKRIEAMRKVHERLSDMEAEREQKAARVHSEKGDVFSTQNDYDNAITEYTVAIKLDHNAVYYAKRGNCYFKEALAFVPEELKAIILADGVRPLIIFP
jgi:tetratricopeptide (TPR) repeat protein